MRIVLFTLAAFMGVGNQGSCAPPPPSLLPSARTTAKPPDCFRVDSFKIVSVHLPCWTPDTVLRALLADMFAGRRTMAAMASQGLFNSVAQVRL